MATITPPTNLPQLAGVPSQWSDTIEAVPEGLIVGETPAAVVVDRQFALSQTIAAYTPVGYNGSGDLVPAVTGSVDPDDDIVPIGITLKDVTVGGASKLGGPILVQACLNSEMITWPASFSTDVLKLNAFNGAPTPTSIVVRKVILGATVAQP